MTSIPARVARLMIDTARAFPKANDGFLKVVGEATPVTSVTISELNANDALVAPAAVWLEATPSGLGVTPAATDAEHDPATHEIEYIWSITLDGDSGYATETYDAVPDLPTAHRVKGAKYGRRIAHVFDRAGTYRVTVTAVNLATGASATSSTATYVIEDPDSYFTAAETLYYAPSGQFGDVPTPNGGTYTSLADIETYIQDDPEGRGRYRIRLKRGYSYEDEIGRPRGGTGSLVILLYDDWGSGTAPKLTKTTGSAGQGTIWDTRSDGQSTILSTHFKNIDIERTIKGTTVSLSYLNTGQTWAMWNCNMTGTAEAAVNGPYCVIGASSGGAWVALANCDFQKLHGVWALNNIGQSFAIIGCAYEHDFDAPASHPEPDDLRQGYGLRNLNSSVLTYMSQCQAYIRSGWYDNVTSIQTTQDVTRFYDAGAGRRYYVERCILSTGYNGLYCAEEGGAMGNMVIERNIILGVHDTQKMITCGLSGTTIRNNLMIRPPSKPGQNSGSFDFGWFVRFTGTLTTDEKAAATRVYNNTMVYLGSTALTGEAIGNTAGITNFVEANNLVHMPNLAVPVDAGPFTLTEILTPPYKGYWDTETPTGNTAETAEYLVDGASTISGTFQAGETVTGGTSGSSRVFTRIHPVWTDALCFETPLIAGPITTNRFSAGETLTGGTSGATATVAAKVQDGTVDTGLYDTLRIPKTVTPTHYIEYDAETGGFTEGETLTGASATAFICQVWDDGATGTLWLSDVSGTFSDNETITDGSTGSATANGTAVSAGTGAFWVPDAAVTPDTATWATTPYARRDFYGTASHNSKGAVKV